MTSRPCMTQCGHLYCKNCIVTWLKVLPSHKGMCPVCKRDLNLKNVYLMKKKNGYPSNISELELCKKRLPFNIHENTVSSISKISYNIVNMSKRKKKLAILKTRNNFEINENISKYNSTYDQVSTISSKLTNSINNNSALSELLSFSLVASLVILLIYLVLM